MGIRRRLLVLAGRAAGKTEGAEARAKWNEFAPIVRPFAHAKVRPGRTTGKSFLGACVQSRFFRRVVNQDPRHSTPHPLGAGIDLMLLGSAMRVNVGRRTAANKPRPEDDEVCPCDSPAGLKLRLTKVTATASSNRKQKPRARESAGVFVGECRLSLG